MITGLDHATIITNKVDETRDFFVDAFGLEVGARPNFGVPGYCFHYLPTLMVLIVVGIGRECPPRGALQAIEPSPRSDRSVPRLLGIAAILTAVFLFYPTDFSAPGWRGDFDLAFCRLTRGGLNRPTPRPAPYVWRTANSRTTASRVETETMYEKPAERAALP